MVRALIKDEGNALEDNIRAHIQIIGRLQVGLEISRSGKPATNLKSHTNTNF